MYAFCQSEVTQDRQHLADNTEFDESCTSVLDIARRKNILQIVALCVGRCVSQIMKLK